MQEKDLYRYKDAKCAFIAALEELEEFDTLIYSPSASYPSPVLSDHGSGDGLRLECLLDRRIEIIQKLNRTMVTVVLESRKMEDIASKLPHRMSEYFRYRYIIGLRPVEIVSRMGISRSNLWKIHSDLIAFISDEPNGSVCLP